MREDAWRRRVDQRALALDPPTWLLAELGPVPSDPHERAVWRVAAAELDGYRRAYGLDHLPPAKHGGGRTTRDGQTVAPATAPTVEWAAGAGEQRERRGRGERARRRGDLGRRPTMVDRGRRADPERLLGAEPRRDEPGRRRDWHAARAALEDLTGWSRHHRDHRHPDRDRASRSFGRDLGRQERDGR
jgi:hypothetical protein